MLLLCLLEDEDDDLLDDEEPSSTHSPARAPPLSSSAASVVGRGCSPDPGSSETVASLTPMVPSAGASPPPSVAVQEKIVALGSRSPPCHASQPVQAAPSVLPPRLPVLLLTLSGLGPLLSSPGRLRCPLLCWCRSESASRPLSGFW
jgi:hypothetical protein